MSYNDLIMQLILSAACYLVPLESVLFRLSSMIFVKVSYNYVYKFYLYVEFVLLFGFCSRIMELV